MELVTMRKGIAFLIAFMVALAAVLAFTGPAGASVDSGNQTCVQGNGAPQDFLTSGTQAFYLAAPNTVNPGSSAVFKAGSSADTFLIHCNTTVNGQPAVAFEFIYQGVPYALRNNISDDNHVVFEPGFLKVSYAQLWYYTGTNPYVFRNVKSGRDLRAPNSGPAYFGPVVAGASVATWQQAP